MPVLSPSAVRKQIAAGTPDSVYLIQGEDDIEKVALAHEFESLVDDGLRAFNIEQIYAGEVTSGDRMIALVQALVASARTLPMMSPRRVVIVLQAEGLLVARRESEASDRAVAQLEGLLQRPEPSTTVVFVAGTLDRRSRVFKLLAKQATVVECGAVEDRHEAEQWIRSRVTSAGAQIEPAAARMLAERAGFPDKPTPNGGGDIRRLRGEVDRLMLYALGQKVITLADAREVAGPAALQDQWAMTNAIESGDAARALRELALVLNAGAAPEKVLGQLGWVVRARLSQAAPARLGAAVDAVFRTDLDLKRSNRSSDQPRILLERLVVELCGERRAGPAR